MMDQFMEEVVTKRNKGMQTATYIFANLLWIFLAFYALLCFSALSRVISEAGFGADFFIVLAQLLVFGGAALGIFLYKDRIKMEYEYTLTNHQLDFAQVYNNKKRKSLGSLNVKNVEAFGKVASPSFQRFLSMPGIKRMNWFLTRDAELYYFYFSKESSRKMIILEPSEEMVDYIRHYLPNGAWRE